MCIHQILCNIYIMHTLHFPLTLHCLGTQPRSLVIHPSQLVAFITLQSENIVQNPLVGFRELHLQFNLESQRSVHCFSSVAASCPT